MRPLAALVAASLLLLPHPSGAEQPAGESLPAGGPLGIGEPRRAEPFTLEQRYLDAARRGDRATLERALDLGADVRAHDDLKRSALLLAAKDAGSLELVELLAGKGVPVDEADLGGRTALSFAATEGHLAIARWLAEHGAAPDRPDAEGRTPLFHAVGSDRREVVTWLLDGGADPNAADRFRDTPLMLACAQGRTEIATLLLARGADPTLRNQEGRTAADRAAPGVEVCRPPAAP
jgi:hypothetical protein